MARKYKLTKSRVFAALRADDNLGFCLACGADAEGVEPDACEYECEECGAHEVHGAEEIVLMAGLA